MTQQSAENILTLASIGIDIGKDVFHIVGFDAGGKIVVRRKIKRLALVAEFKKLPSSIVGMEACLSAHFVSRTLRKLGHEPRIIPAIYVKPYLKGQKNDYNDAEAIAEAALRPNLRCVTEKTQDQLDLPPCPVASGVTKNGDHQPDPGLSDRTGHYRAHRRPCAAQVPVRYPGEP